MSFSEKDVCDILEKNASDILGNRVSEAVRGVQETVKQLVKKAELPDDIAIRYQAFAGDEDLLYSSESYRDHFFHPFHTFLLGFIIISKLKLSQQNKIPLPLNDEFLKKWLLTSLWHDITYAAEKGPSWLTGFIKKRLGFDIRASQEWGPILSTRDNIDASDKLSLKFESGNKDRQLIFRTWLNKQIEKQHDHGVLSAILLLRDANNWKLDKTIVNECGLAIALHNYHMALSGDIELITKKGSCLFNWNEIPGNDDAKLRDFLMQSYDVDWVKTAKIEKSNDKNIKVYTQINSLSLRLNDEKTKVNLKIDGNRNDEFIAMTVNRRVNIWQLKDNDNSAIAINLGSLSVKDYPLAFLLAYCDTAQDWGRPSSKKTNNYSTYGDVEIDENLKDINILLNYNLNEYIKIKKKTSEPITSYTELVEEENKKFKKMQITWKSDEWGYYIKPIGFDEKKNIGGLRIKLAEVLT